MGTWDAFLLQKMHQLEARVQRRITVTEFAQFLGEEQPTVSRWLAGKNQPDSVEKIDRLADLLGEETYAALGLSKPDPMLRYVIKNWDKISPETKQKICADIDDYRISPNHTSLPDTS